MVGLLRHWGMGLDLGLCEEAASYLCGQPLDVESNANIRLGDQLFGEQPMRMSAPDVALKITAKSAEGQAEFQSHLERFQAHADPGAIQWTNIARPVVRLKLGLFINRRPEQATQDPAGTSVAAPDNHSAKFLHSQKPGLRGSGKRFTRPRSGLHE
jgi:hypothetical protein